MYKKETKLKLIPFSQSEIDKITKIAKYYKISFIKTVKKLIETGLKFSEFSANNRF